MQIEEVWEDENCQHGRPITHTAGEATTVVSVRFTFTVIILHVVIGIRDWPINARFPWWLFSRRFASRREYHPALVRLASSGGSRRREPLIDARISAVLPGSSYRIAGDTR